MPTVGSIQCTKCAGNVNSCKCEGDMPDIQSTTIYRLSMVLGQLDNLLKGRQKDQLDNLRRGVKTGLDIYAEYLFSPKEDISLKPKPWYTRLWRWICR